jgi:hypothetical protein
MGKCSGASQVNQGLAQVAIAALTHELKVAAHHLVAPMGGLRMQRSHGIHETSVMPNSSSQTRGGGKHPCKDLLIHYLYIQRHRIPAPQPAENRTGPTHRRANLDAPRRRSCASGMDPIARGAIRVR